MANQDRQRIAGKSLIAISISILFLLSSCGNNTKNESEDKVTEEQVVTEQPITVGDNKDAKLSEILLVSGDAMKFDKKEIRVKSGQTVKLTLKHSGTMPKSAMGHNFVLLKNSISLTDFGTAAAQSKVPDYGIPAELLKDVIAHTKMIGGGETDVIEFPAPEKGTYEFLCSFPGHYGMMKGKFIVE